MSGERVIRSVILFIFQAEMEKNNFVMEQQSHTRSHFESLCVQETLQHYE
jgi:hypothetical protein